MRNLHHHHHHHHFLLLGLTAVRVTVLTMFVSNVMVIYCLSSRGETASLKTAVSSLSLSLSLSLSRSLCLPVRSRDESSLVRWSQFSARWGAIWRTKIFKNADDYSVEPMSRDWVSIEVMKWRSQMNWLNHAQFHVCLCVTLSLISYYYILLSHYYAPPPSSGISWRTLSQTPDSPMIVVSCGILMIVTSWNIS